MKIKLNKKLYKLNVAKFIWFWICVFVILVCLWNVVSYIDVIAHNLSGGTDHAWNLYVIAMNKFGGTY